MMRKKHPSLLICLYFCESFVNLEHGTYTVCLKGNIVFLQLFGEFNEYSVIAFVKEIELIVNKLDGKPFGILVNNLNLIGATPEAYVESDKHNQWLSTQNLLGKATVYPSNYLINVDALLVKSKSELNVKNFDELSDAFAWLESLSSLELIASNEYSLKEEQRLALVS